MAHLAGGGGGNKLAPKLDLGVGIGTLYDPTVTGGE